jgi:hypothetical protein
MENRKLPSLDLQRFSNGKEAAQSPHGFKADLRIIDREDFFLIKYEFSRPEIEDLGMELSVVSF